MKSRVAVTAIIVENSESVSKLNDLLHDSGDYILGRMGLPYKQRGINIIRIALDAPEDVINTLAGKIGRLNGVTVKTAYSNASDTD